MIEDHKRLLKFEDAVCPRCNSEAPQKQVENMEMCERCFIQLIKEVKQELGKEPETTYQATETESSNNLIKKFKSQTAQEAQKPVQGGA